MTGKSPSLTVKKDKIANRYSAKAGHSEHELGTAIDFNSGEGSAYLAKKFAETPEGMWLASHSFEYGFIMSYPKGQEDKTGYIFEPWHFRFIGVSASTEAHDTKLSMQDYIEQKNNTVARRLIRKESRLLRADGSDHIYYITDKGYRHLISNPEEFLSYGNSWQDVKIVSNLELSVFPEIP